MFLPAKCVAHTPIPCPQTGDVYFRERGGVDTNEYMWPASYITEFDDRMCRSLAVFIHGEKVLIRLWSGITDSHIQAAPLFPSPPYFEQE